MGNSERKGPNSLGPWTFGPLILHRFMAMGLGLGILHRLTGEKPVKMSHHFTSETSVQIGEKPVKLFHRSLVNRQCGEFLQSPTLRGVRPAFPQETMLFWSMI